MAAFNPTNERAARRRRPALCMGSQIRASWEQRSMALESDYRGSSGSKSSSSSLCPERHHHTSNGCISWRHQEQHLKAEKTRGVYDGSSRMRDGQIRRASRWWSARPPGVQCMALKCMALSVLCATFSAAIVTGVFSRLCMEWGHMRYRERGA